MEPARYDRDQAQFILNMYRRERIPPGRSYYFGLGLSVDANFQGMDSTPPIVLLNFIYSVAAYQRRQSPPGIGIIEKYFEDHYKTIPVPPPRAPSSERKGRHHTSAMEKAMDDVDLVFMFLRATTPEEAATRREKRLEEEEQMAQEAGRRKVMEWIETNRTRRLMVPILSILEIVFPKYQYPCRVSVVVLC